MQNKHMWQRIAIAVISLLLFVLPSPAQQAAGTATGTSQSAPAASAGQTPDTQQSAEAPGTAPTKKEKKEKKQEKSVKKKKREKNDTAAGPPTALCNDGTFSHEKPARAGGRSNAGPCKGNGGVDHYFQ